jgi:radical SAM-linked protein
MYMQNAIKGDVHIEVPNENLGGFAERLSRDGTAKSILALVRFKVWGLSRFLSHAETLRIFQRACIRANIPLIYSQGYNPRPRLSLPLPRSVGIESDDELFCVRLKGKLGFLSCEEVELQARDYESKIKTRLSEQLPEGLEVVSVSLADTNSSFQPISATYVLPVKSEYIDDSFRAEAQQLLSSESLYITRSKGPVSRHSHDSEKKIDVRPFLESIEFNDQGIVLRCNISSAGSIRIDEILMLLQLDIGKLALPIRRVNIRWREARVVNKNANHQQRNEG